MENNDHVKKGYIAVLLCAVIVIAMVMTGCSGGGKSNIIENTAQLNDPNYTICVHQGSASALAAIDLFPKASILYTSSISDAYMSVEQGKADAVVYGKLYMKYAIKSGGLTDLKIMDETLKTSDVAAGVAKGRDDLLGEVNAFIAKIKADGTLDDMINRWTVIDDNNMPEIEVPKSPTRTFKFGTAGLVEPMNYYDENQQLTGFDVELMKRLALEMNADVKIEAMSFDALLASLQSGKLDVVVSDLNVTKERQEVILMSEGYMQSLTGVLVKGDRLRTQSIDDESVSGTGFIDQILNSFRRTFITDNRWKLILSGLLVTLELSIVSAILGTALGFFVSFPLRSKNKIIRKISDAISRFLNGMPLVVILMVLYYIIFSKVDISPVWVGIFGFSLDFANTVAGLLNTGVTAVDNGQLEAAQTMGYNKRQIFCKITLPQAARQMFSQYEGAIVGLVKGTAIIGYITVQDLTKASDIIRSRTYEAFFPLIMTAIVYFLISYLLVSLLKRVGLKLDPKRRKRKISGVVVHD